MEVKYREANIQDITEIANFTDFWLGGLGISAGVPGAGHDFFIPKGRHEAYLRKYRVLLALHCKKIIGWAVLTNKKVLIHLLVAGTFRGQGIGMNMLKMLQPEIVRSKTDQSTGNPESFYRKAGYIPLGAQRHGKKKNIQLFVHDPGKKSLSDTDFHWANQKSPIFAEPKKKSGPNKQRTIDLIVNNICRTNEKSLQ